jgi:hypothetical protein
MEQQVQSERVADAASLRFADSPGGCSYMNLCAWHPFTLIL